MLEFCFRKHLVVVLLFLINLAHMPSPPPIKPLQSSFCFSLPSLQKTTSKYHHLQIYSLAMLASDVAAIHYLASENLSPFPTDFAMFPNTIPPFQFSNNAFLTNFPNHQLSPPFQDFAPQSSCLSNNSTSDEAEEHQRHTIVDERKQRRMISNRESARRSRMRKQKHLDELWSLVVRLRTENRHLIDKLNHVSECHDKVVQENVQLKEEASDLHQVIIDLHLGSPLPSLRDLEEVTCNTAHLRAESSNQSITTTSTNMLH
ncbi:basic leucine zipper 43 [Rhododendron vialii]|uniref:basic leucine zipper 43 n=1 Tax=Rhododendron vialii TaxID=182163 RepID=UPI00265F91F0|nr:basic leucine zipper 43 [Rhododendron vialii]